MIQGLGDIEVRDLALSDVATLHMAVKFNSDKPFIDARKWLQYPNLDTPCATPKGLMLSIDQWEHAIPLLQELIKQFKNRT